MKEYFMSERIEHIIIHSLKQYPHSWINQSQCIRLIGTLAYQNDLLRRRLGK
jgi:hypothetical protein